MSIFSKHLRENIIRKTLAKMGPQFNSKSAENLLLYIAAHESKGGTYLRQKPQGPARSIYQIERATYDDIMKWIEAKHEMLLLLRNFNQSFEDLEGNLYFATFIARMILYRVPEALPAAHDLEGLTRYWKKYWNTERGAGTVQKFLDDVAWYLKQE